MSHADTILELPKGFELLATTESIPIAAFKKSEAGVSSQESETETDSELRTQNAKLRTHDSQLSSLWFTISSRSVSFHRRQKNPS